MYKDNHNNLWFSRFLISIVLIAKPVYGVVPAEATRPENQHVFLVAPNRLSIEADGVPLVNLLEELSHLVEIERILMDPKAERVAITVSVNNVDVRGGISEILDSADLSYTVWGGNGTPIRIFAGSPESSDEVPTTQPSWLEESGRSARERASRRQETDTSTATPNRRDSLRATGYATRPTEDAHLSPATVTRLAGTYAILLFGCLLGYALVCRPDGHGEQVETRLTVTQDKTNRVFRRD